MNLQMNCLLPPIHTNRVTINISIIAITCTTNKYQNKSFNKTTHDVLQKNIIFTKNFF